MPTTTFDKYVFNTRDTIRYRFPTHITDLVMDRSEAQTSEAFIVVLELGEAPPLHVHHDTEQVFYVLQGDGELYTGTDPIQCFPVSRGDLIRIPAGTYHQIRCGSREPLRYLSIDCFLRGQPVDEPTWESHLKVVCKERGINFEKIERGSLIRADGRIEPR